MSDDHAMTIVAALAAGMREVLGSFAGAKHYGRAATLLESQLRHLATVVPGVHAAAGQLVRERVHRLVSSEEAAEIVLTDPSEPNHAFFLMVATDTTIRRTAAFHAREEDNAADQAKLMAYFINRSADGSDREED